ncbi:MAG: cache domain-containing protein [Rubritepida sp.]|nr:cache domain-containing protein [Rubritepida sp.]
METLRKMASRLPAPGLAARITLLGVAGIVLAIFALQLWEARTRDAQARAALESRLDRDLALLEGVTAQLGGGGAWRLDEQGRLARGTFVLDGANAVVDIVSRSSGGVATIFKGDERIATSVVRPDGTRATGTRLAPGAAHDAAVRGGRTYRGVNNILGSDHITIYEPIRDATGRQLGLLFVGQSTASIEAAARAQKWQAALAAAVVMVLAAALLWGLLMRSLRPLRDLEGWVRAGAASLANPVPHAARRDEIGAMARALEGFREEALAKRALEERMQAAQAERERRAAEAAAAMERFGGNVGRSMGEFGAAAEAMLDATQRLGAAMTRTGERVTGTASEASESSENLQAVAAALEEMSATVSEINAQVARAAAAAAEAVQEAQQSDARIQALTRSADRIGDILGVISDVHRGGARGRGGQGLRRGGERGEEPRRADRQGHGGRRAADPCHARSDRRGRGGHARDRGGDRPDGRGDGRHRRGRRAAGRDDARDHRPAAGRRPRHEPCQRGDGRAGRRHARGGADRAGGGEPGRRRPDRCRQAARRGRGAARRAAPQGQRAGRRRARRLSQGPGRQARFRPPGPCSTLPRKHGGGSPWQACST